MDSKAFREVVRVLTARHPRITALPKQIYTPPASRLAARMAWARLALPSLSGRTIGHWEPVSTTGKGGFCSKKVSMEAV